MLRGLLLGSVSGLALSALLLASVSLIAPPHGPLMQRPVAALPDAPVLLDQAEAAPRLPDPLPQREAAPVAAPAAVPSAGAVPVSAPVAAPPAREAATEVAAAVPLPAASAFNRPREDGAVVTPDADPVARPMVATGSLAASAFGAGERPAPETESAGRPRETRIEGFGAVPEAGEGPNLPQPLSESAPRTFADSLPGDADPGLSSPAEGAAISVPSAGEAPDSPAVSAPPPARPAATPIPIAAPGPVVSPAVEAGPPTVARMTTLPVGISDTSENRGVTPARETLPTQTAEAELAQTRMAQLDPARRKGGPAIRLIDDAERVRLPAAGVDGAAEDSLPPIVRAVEPEAQVQAGTGEMPRRLLLDSERKAGPAEAAGMTLPAAPAPGARAMTLQAAAFDNAAGLPLLSVVLIDDPDGGVAREELLDLGFPVTFAIDPTRAGAADTARAYRAAGHEVVMLAAALAPGGTAQDIEVGMGAARAAVPQALGVLDGTGGDFAGNRPALDALLPSLAEAGMGFLTYPTGLNTGIVAARRSGVPALSTYRTLDDEDEGAAVIARYLDRATFAAVQDGAVVVVGHARRETVTALTAWRAGSRSGEVALAPLSAALDGFGS